MRQRIKASVFMFAWLAATTCFAAPLDPNAFSSLGTLNVTSGTLTINTTTLQMTGAASFNGISMAQYQGSPVAVFVFDSINISGTSISIVGTRAVALLSKGNATIQSAINVNGGPTNGTNGGPGGYGGALGAPGNGPGGGRFSNGYSTGGGFGGAGGGIFSTSGPSVLGGQPYGDLWTTLEGGSGGAGTLSDAGWGGGGAVQISAIGALTVSTINANGGGSSGGGNAGGAGGGILLTGSTVAYTNLSAVGGAGNVGGGGGRVRIHGVPSYTLGTVPAAIALSGGNNSFNPDRAGFAGVFTIEAASSIVPSGASIVLDDQPVMSVLGSNNRTTPTVEAVIERDLTIETGGTVTLGKSNVLKSNANLTVNGVGTFNTDAYSQTIGGLTGSGNVVIGNGGELVVGAGDISSTFGGSVSGEGRLTKTGFGTTTFSDSVGNSGGIDVQDGTIRVTGMIGPSTKYGSGNLVFAGLPSSPGPLHIREGRVTFESDSSNPSPVTIEGTGILAVDDSQIDKRIYGNSASSLIETIGTSTLGNANYFNGFRHSGIFNQSGSTTINSRGFATLGVLTTIDGNLTAPNGIALPTGSAIQGAGSVSAKIAAGFGSVIEATGNLALGTAASPTGFTSDGELRTGIHSVTINDSNEAVLGSLTQLGDGSSGGSLVAGDAQVGETQVHLLLGEGKNLVGRGNVVGNFKNNGHVLGDGPGTAEKIIFDADWTVSGAGTLENATVLGTYSPGNSPAVVSTANLGLGGTLKIELGGTSPGFGPNNHDQVVDNSTVVITEGSDLVLELWNNFIPTIGDQFEVLTWNEGLEGTFSQILTDPLFGSQGIAFTASYTNPTGPGSLVLTAVAALPGDFDLDGDVDGRDFLIWQRGGSPTALSANDLGDWQNSYGVSSLTATNSAVPEPSIFFLISAGGIVIAIRHRR
jgi:hypothetical protein